MIKIQCRYKKLSDVPNLQPINHYKESVNPLDYDFYLKLGEHYDVLGIELRSGVPWLYVVTDKKNKEVRVLPGVLFSFGWNKVPDNWMIRLNEFFNQDLELLPKSLASIDNWFEKYINEAPDALRAVEHEINKMF